VEGQAADDEQADDRAHVDRERRAGGALAALRLLRGER